MNDSAFPGPSSSSSSPAHVSVGGESDTVVGHPPTDDEQSLLGSSQPSVQHVAPPPQVSVILPRQDANNNNSSSCSSGGGGGDSSDDYSYNDQESDNAWESDTDNDVHNSDNSYNHAEEEVDEDDDDDDSSSNGCFIAHMWGHSILEEALDEQDDDDDDRVRHGNLAETFPKSFFVRESTVSECCLDFLEDRVRRQGEPSQRLQRMGLAHTRQPTHLASRLQQFVLSNAASLQSLTLVCDEDHHHHHGNDDNDDNDNNNNPGPPTLPEGFVRLLPQLPRLCALRLGGYDLSGSAWFPHRILVGQPPQEEGNAEEPTAAAEAVGEQIETANHGNVENNDHSDNSNSPPITHLKLLHCSLPNPESCTALATAFRTYNGLEQLSLHGCRLGNAKMIPLLDGLASNPHHTLRFLELQMNSLLGRPRHIHRAADGASRPDPGIWPSLVRLLQQQPGLTGLDLAANDGLFRMPALHRKHATHAESAAAIPQALHDFCAAVGSHANLEDLNMGSCGVQGTTLAVLLQALQHNSDDDNDNQGGGRGRRIALRGLHLSGNEHLYVEEQWTKHLPRLAIHHMCLPVRAPQGCAGDLCTSSRRSVGRRLFWTALQQNTRLWNVSVTNPMDSDDEDDEDHDEVPRQPSEPPLVTQDEVDALMDRNQLWRRVQRHAPRLPRTYWASLLQTLLRQEQHGVAHLLLHTHLSALSLGHDPPPRPLDDDEEKGENQNGELQAVD